MLFIKDVRHLAKMLEHPIARVEEVLASPESYYERYCLLDPRKDKVRHVVKVIGELRLYQRRLYDRLFLRKLEPSPCSYGGIRGRTLRDQAAQHLDSIFVFKADISNFYPSITHDRVYRLFVDDFRCSPDVARICTRICTYRYHLALGLITSPILADQILRRVDARLKAACDAQELTYTRWVDDVSISAPHDLDSSGIRRLLSRVLHEHGFRTNPSKDECGRLSYGLTISKVRVRRGRFDVEKEYYAELERQLADATSLAANGPFEGPYYNRDQIRGRVQFVSWVNPGRRQALRRLFSKIHWPSVHERAKEREYIACATSLVLESQLSGNASAAR